MKIRVLLLIFLNFLQRANYLKILLWKLLLPKRSNSLVSVVHFIFIENRVQVSFLCFLRVFYVAQNSKQFIFPFFFTEREGGEEDAPKDEIEESKQLTLQELREKNAELRLVCEELTRELASALQERINLRAKLLLLT